MTGSLGALKNEHVGARVWVRKKDGATGKGVKARTRLDCKMKSRRFCFREHVRACVLGRTPLGCLAFPPISKFFFVVLGGACGFFKGHTNAVF
jgi:hypothetical protein